MTPITNAELRIFEESINEAAEKGDADVAMELTREMQRRMIATNPQVLEPRHKIGRAGLGDAMRSVLRKEGDGGQVLAGIGTAPALAGHGIAELFGYGETAPHEGNRNTSADWKALRDATPATQAGNVIGNVGLFAAMPPRLGGAILGPASRSETLARVLATRPAQVLDVAASQGLIGALTTPGNWEERGIAGLSAAGAAGIPAGTLAAAQGARRKLTTGGRNVQIGEEIRQDLGPRNADRIIADLQGEYPGAQYGVQPSAGMATRDPTLQTWEVGSRTRSGNLWTPFDKQNAEARWNRMNDIGDPKLIEALKAGREELTQPLRREAMAVGNMTNAAAESVGIPEPVLTPIRQRINILRTGEFAHDPNVQKMVNWLEKNLDNATPEQLYHARKLMTDAIPQGPADELGQSLKAARPQRIELVQMIDDALNTVTGGHYGDYMAAYKRASPEIASRSAVERIAKNLRGGAAEGIVPDTMGVSPGFRGVERLTEREGTRQFGSKSFDQLTPEHRQFMETLAADLRAQSEGMRGHAIIGSRTAPNAAAAGKGADALARVLKSGAAAGGGVPGAIAAQGVDAALAHLTRVSEQELAQLLQNPKALADALRAAARAERITSGTQRAGAGGAQSTREFFIQR